ncbi:MAG: bifunctional diaminohydroxyphosphoribosylaminopyrimidine deaminase/5-amino-6-(5-phosphoribosylamino)uracil reductase, partial [Oscillatoriales cyanobacterium]
METFEADAKPIANLANRQQQGTKQLDNSTIQEFDRAMMRRCIELARRALGKTAPNPLVGSVV